MAELLFQSFFFLSFWLLRSKSHLKKKAESKIRKLCEPPISDSLITSSKTYRLPRRKQHKKAKQAFKTLRGKQLIMHCFFFFFSRVDCLTLESHIALIFYSAVSQSHRKKAQKIIEVSVISPDSIYLIHRLGKQRQKNNDKKERAQQSKALE